jgi:hypothetical protein
MREITNDEWNSLIINFQENQFYDCTLSECLENFIFEYGVLLENAKNEEGMKVDFEKDTNTKINNLWDYMYNLQRQINTLNSKIGDLESHKTQTYGPVKYPNNIPPTHTPLQPYSFPDTPIWTVSSSNMYDNAPPNNQVAIGTSGGFMSTTGGTTVTLNGVSAGTVKVKGLYD